jgi:hypothetical protein
MGFPQIRSRPGEILQAHPTMAATAGRGMSSMKRLVFDSTIPYDIRFFESLDRMAQAKLERHKAMVSGNADTTFKRLGRSRSDKRVARR